MADPEHGLIPVLRQLPVEQRIRERKRLGDRCRTRNSAPKTARALLAAQLGMQCDEIGGMKLIQFADTGNYAF
ncbi:hypothetical protein ACJ73_04479 [Blastomyces percursus]|uniref:Uncharacterized protein n=1 Tax=Blastomyces percursus TaxID=1658174 RepID=A0A1J9Q6I8_9EURO|nr:hypothetical protein ACJ73_04479 [Blastomyces percursus]